MNNIAFCFDLDGTITKEEILPLLAKEINLFEEINVLTDITMRGMMRFEQSFKLRVKLLSEIKISLAQNIVEMVEIDKDICNFIHENKNNCYVISGNLDVWIAKIIKKLDCKCFCSSALYKNDKIVDILNIIKKDEVINNLKKQYKTVIAVGDGMNDADMFKKSDISIAFGGFRNPSQSLIELSDYVIFNGASLCKMLKML